MDIIMEEVLAGLESALTESTLEELLVSSLEGTGDTAYDDLGSTLEGPTEV